MNKTVASAGLAVAALTVLGAARLHTPTLPPLAAMQQLESPAAPGSAMPNLTVGADGRVYLSWLEPAPDSATALRFASYDGAKWGITRTIRAGKDYFVNWADFPSLAVNKNGRIAAHWLQRHGTASYMYDVRIAISTDAGRTWAPPMAPHVDRSSTEKGFVTMWPEGEGFGAVWLDGRKADKTRPDAKQEMMVLSTNRAGVEQPTETIVDDRACDCCQTTVALTSDGPIAAYRDRTANEIRDIYVSRRVNGRWTPGKAVHNDGWEINACPVNGPYLGASGKSVALAWYTAAKDQPRVKVAFSSDAGATFGAPITVDLGQPSGRVATTLLADGSALVSWIERTGGDTAGVLVRRVTSDGKLGAPVTVAASSASRASGFPRMALAGDQLYFAWTQPGRPSSVRVARMAAASFK